MKRVTITSTVGGQTNIRTYDSAPRQAASLWPNPTPGQRYTQDKVHETYLRLWAAYRGAASDLLAKQQDFEHFHQRRVDRHQAELRAGLITQADYDAWMRGQVFQREAWAMKRAQLIRIMQDIDRRSLDILQTGRLDVFAENANYMHYRIDMVTGLTGTFGLYNRNAVMRLIAEQPQVLPMAKLDDAKTFQKYNKIISDCVTQGILQGEDLHQIAYRISQETATRGLTALRRDTRTAYVSAMNAGAMQTMREAQALGIRLHKGWMATLDMKTRDSHAFLDGQTVPVDEPFQSLIGEIMYPGDMAADPADVWNCRCTLYEFYPDHDTGTGLDRFDADGNYVGGMTYQEWLEEFGGEEEE